MNSNSEHDYRASASEVRVNNPRIVTAAEVSAALGAATTTDLVRMHDEELLTGLVMRLTGGAANPLVVRGIIRQIKAGKPDEPQLR
jgi:Asp-tRNA(Asn)/Glu-tRNA(Gln) amidotransferase B subunit